MAQRHVGKRPLAFLLLLAVWSCSPRIESPELPSIDTRQFQSSVRAVIDPPLERARRNPKDPEANFALGQALHAHQQFSLAAIAYQRAVAADLRKPGYSYLWGAALASASQHPQAAAALRLSLIQRPDSIAARLRLADSLLAAGDSAAAASEYKMVLSLNPSLPQALYGYGRTQSGEEAVAALRKASDSFPRYGAARFALAAALRKLGRSAEAEQALVNYERDKLIAPPLDDPDMAEVDRLDASATGLLRRAASSERAGQLKEALRLHEQAAAADPKLVQVWVNLISLQARLKNPSAAEAAFRKAVELEPDRAEAYYNYGVLCAESGRTAEGRKAFEKTIALDPANPEARHNLGVIVEQTGDLGRAARLFEGTLERNPGHRSAYFHLGRIYANQKRYPEAVAAFEQAVEPADEMTPSVLYALGAVHARSRNRAKAIEYLQRARAAAAQRGQPAVLSSIERDLALLNRP